ncbi:putative Ntn-hydrolase superfamily protein [Tepidamorphus gemmatus]|uniref:Putative Ntn-hydrolase superfamily protein n=1 Tax=Tepidamorphus gemmatus TaxID=747076 RepID=A0A4R3LR19_9HYPH|nr:DUF1028 domain-containing protein [Tepidamorphus gemmatus]TCT03024.1 putative Ntn-hydrolase superfamily protein [Tepidamorphus gemmatus]
MRRSGRLEVNTFSIVGRCRRTGELGVAVASAVPAVGAICIHLVPGVGAASSQSWVNPYLAIDTLDAMAGGKNAADALAAAITADPAAELRQIGVIGTGGPGAAFTGLACTAWHGHLTGPDHAVQGNMLTGPEVTGAMAAAFAADPGLPLEERLMRALEAGQAAGGDRRGRQSAGLAVIGAEAFRRVDLRVDDHSTPIAELRRVLDVASAQLAPFVAGMPRRGAPAAPAPREVVDLLALSPPDRPGGGGSRTP